MNRNREPFRAVLSPNIKAQKLHEKWKIFFQFGVIGIPLLGLLIWFCIGQSRTNRSDYIGSAYILTPKDSKKGYIYAEKNTMDKTKKVKKIILPADIVAGKTKNYDDRTGTTGHLDSAFYNDTNVDLKNRITISPTMSYPLDTKADYLRIISVKHLSKYKAFDTKTIFVAPSLDRKIDNNEGSQFSSEKIRYLRLDEYKISFKKKYNISKSKDQICIGLIDKDGNA